MRKARKVDVLTFDLITEIDKYEAGWRSGMPETPCGFGSKVAQTEIQRQWLPKVVKDYGIRTIADIGAGDLNWIPLVKWQSEIEYTAYDLVPRHDSVKKFDIVQEIPPAVDMLMAVWVLNHFPEAHARAAMNNLLASGSKYLLLTYEPRMWDFTDLAPIESKVIRRRPHGDIRGDVELRLIKC